MTWSEQTDSMMKVWTEAQKKLWENWYEMTQSMSNPTTFFSGMGMYNQWQQLSSRWIEAMNDNSEPAAKNLSRQFVAAQSTMMNFLEMTTKAWNTMIPKLGEGQDWQTVLNEYMDQFRKQMLNPAQMMQNPQQMADMWYTYAQSMQTAMLPWMKPLQQAPGVMGVAMAGQNGGAELIDLTRMFWQAYDQTMGRFVGMPGVGFTRELEEKMAKGYKAWSEARQAMDEYQLLVADAWSGVMEEVLREMMKRAEKGQPIESVRDLIRMWTTAADNSFDKVFRSEKYAEVQGKFVTTYMHYRIEEQQIVDEMLKYSHIPTRTEVDEAHRNIYELRKEVKALKKALKGSGASSPAAAPPAPAKPKSAATADSKKPETPAN